MIRYNNKVNEIVMAACNKSWKTFSLMTAMAQRNSDSRKPELIQNIVILKMN